MYFYFILFYFMFFLNVFLLIFYLSIFIFHIYYLNNKKEKLYINYLNYLKYIPIAKIETFIILLSRGKTTPSFAVEFLITII